MIFNSGDLKLVEEGFRNFDSKTLTEKEKRFIKKLVDFKPWR